MSTFCRHRPRSVLLTALATVFVAALVAAPGAFASSLSMSGGTLTYTPDPADTAGVSVGFGEPAAGSIEVQTYDADAITSVPAGCTAATSPPPFATSDYTCGTSVSGPAVTSVVASTPNVASSLSASGASAPAVSDIPVTLNGGTGPDILFAGKSTTTLNGGAGNDNLDGGSGTDTLNGGDGNDTLQAGTGPATMSGGNGSDTIYPDNATDTVSGGAGVDQVIYSDQTSVGGPPPNFTTSYVPTDVTVSLDGVANDGYAGNNSNIETDVEDVSVQDVQDCSATPAGASCAYGNAVLTGDSGPNSLSGGSGNDTLTGGGGGDFLSGNLGNNTLNGVNGYPDRLDCGGTGTANADQLDTVVDCTTTNKTTLSNVGLITQDRAPTVSWTSPKENAKVNPSKANTFQVAATPGTHPITQVAYYVGERTACITKTPPYTCAYKAKDTDVGKETLMAIATDSIGLTSTKMRTITVTTFKPKKLSASTKPKRIKKAPYRFTTTGRLSLPAGVSTQRGCTGKVSVTFKDGKKKVGGGTAKVKSNCSYSSKVKIVFAKGKKHGKTLSVSVAFGGNTTLTKASVKSYKVRIS